MTPRVRQLWWENSAHPFFVPWVSELNRVEAFGLARPPRCASLEAAIEVSLLTSLRLNDLQVFDAEASSEEVQRFLGRAARVHLGGQPALDVGAAVQVLGVFWRLRAGVPTFLVFSKPGEDLVFSKLLGEMLRAPAAAPVAALDAASGTAAALGALLVAAPGAAEERPLVLVRCDRAALEVADGGRQLALADTALFPAGAATDGRGPAPWVLASLSYVDASALALLRRLPPRLREAVVFFAG